MQEQSFRWIRDLSTGATVPTGPCCSIAPCPFGGCHTPHAYGEGRCPGVVRQS